jgi:hypothetical protein
MKIYFLFFALFLFACESAEVDEVEIESMNGRVGSDIVDESSAANEINEDAIWSFYEGRMGTYEQQVVLELGILGTEITGRYFYARHQDFLALEGNFDSITETYYLTESYRGKITGYIKFTANSEGNLEGSWSKLEESDPEPFIATKLDLTVDDMQLNVDFERYDFRHEVLIYSGVSNESDVTPVVDEIMISHLDEKYFSFHYSIIGGNGHLGSIDGLGIRTSADSAEYRSPANGCVLSFAFANDSIVISEQEDCSFYRGMRAHFGNSLGKVQKGLVF